MMVTLLDDGREVIVPIANELLDDPATFGAYIVRAWQQATAPLEREHGSDR